MVPRVQDGRVPTPEEVDACQTIAKQVIEDCFTSETNIGGAKILDPDHVFHDVFVTQSNLTCAYPH